MPAKDPRVSAHHLVVNVIVPGMAEHLKTLNDVVVVRHEGGKRGDHPHYHCYIQHKKPCTAQTTKNRLWSHESFKPIEGSTMFSMRPFEEGGVENFWGYVWHDPYLTKRPTLICWNLDTPQLDIPQKQNLVLETPTRYITLPDTPKSEKSPEIFEKKSGVKQKSALEKQQAFLAYCRQWYNEFPTDEITHRRLARLLYEYCGRNGFTTEWCMYSWVSFAYYHLNAGNEQQHEEAADRFCDRLCAKFF